MKTDNNYKVGDLVLVGWYNDWDDEMLGVITSKRSDVLKIKLLEKSEDILGDFLPGEIITRSNMESSYNIRFPKSVQWEPHTRESCPTGGYLRGNQWGGSGFTIFGDCIDGGIIVPCLQKSLNVPLEDQKSYPAHWVYYSFESAAKSFLYSSGDGIWLPFARPIIGE